MAKQILVLSQYWHPENGVPQRRWTWLTRILVDAGYEVTVITPPPHYQRKMDLKTWWQERRFFSAADSQVGRSGERIIRSGFIPAGNSLTLRVLNQATVALGAIWVILKRPGSLRGYRPDLVIGTVPALPTAAATWFTAVRFRAPYIIDLRDAWPDLLEESSNWNKSTGRRSIREKIFTKGPLQLLSALTRKVVNLALKNSAGISVTSSYLAEDLQTRRELQTNGHTPPVTTVRNVFPAETNFVKDGKPRSRNGRLNVLYAGTFGRAQNLENALKAAELAKAQGVDVSLRLVGAGVTRAALTDSVARRGLNVSLESRQPAEDLAPFYDWADTALVHLTDWVALEKAVPSKTYELMAARVHISGVVSGEAAELIRDRGAGDVVTPENPQALADLWVALARDPARLVTSGMGPEWVAREREHVARRRLLSLIDNAIG